MLRNSALSVMALFLTFSLVYIFIVYPNDSRISNLSDDLPPIQGSWKKIASMFTTDMGFELNLSSKAYHKRLGKFAESYTNHIEWLSDRFHNPYQLYLAGGSHPHLIEGRDAVFLPSGARLTLRPTFVGDIRVEFASVALKTEAVLSVQVNDKKVRELHLPKVPPPEDPNSLRYKIFTRYGFPDRMPHTGVWQTHSLELSFRENDTLTFFCESNEDTCFLSDVTFLTGKAGQKSQNVILILVDTLRYDALLGEHAEFLNRVRMKSLDFVNAVGAGNMTSISTNALLSCQRPTELEGVAFSYGVSKQDQENFYKKRRASFPELLRGHGVTTAAIGNLSIISDILGIGVDHGFDEEISIETEGYDTAQITRAAQHWLGQNGDRPFFLYLHYNSPHAPYRAPLKDVLATFKGWKSISSLRNMLLSLYQAEIRYVDRYLDKLLRTLDDLRLKDHTTVIVTSDHGDHHEIRTFSDNRAGEAYTGSTFDHGETLTNDEIHVPLLIHLPQSPSHKIVTPYVSSLDIGPTILDMFDIASPPWCSGLSLVASDEDSLKNRVVASEGFSQRAIFSESRFKYIKSYATSKRSLVTPSGFLRANADVFAGEQLFDLEKDPGEQVNLLSRDDQTLQLMQDYFQDYFGIFEQLELVIDAFQDEPVEVLFSVDDKEKLFLDEQYTENSEGILFQDRGGKRLRIPFREAPHALPQVKIGGSTIQVTYTSYHLPLSGFLDNLPVEREPNLEGRPLTSKNAAFFVKSPKDPRKGQKIEIGNPQFERLFREWGYLNDNNGS